MKYTIELTDNQKKQMDLLCELAHRYIGFNPKLEPIENLWESELEKHRKQAYNSAINDYNEMIQWLHDCTDDFKRFMNVKYGYDIMYLGNPKVDEGVMLYDLICDHDIAEVISEFKKWQEEKKKAEEESIKIGDEVKDLSTNNIGIVLSVGNMIVYITEISHIYSNTRGSLEKTGRHFGDEVEQLLSKLKVN